jgi:DNA repair protein RAD50
MKKASPAEIAENKREMGEWEEELERLQKLMPIQASRDQIKLKELPALEEQIKAQEESYPDISHRAEEVNLLKNGAPPISLINYPGYREG